MAGAFITFEGVEGAGKTTQIGRLKAWLAEQGADVVLTREPGGTPGAETIRDLLVRGETASWTPMAECLLVNAARSDHLDRLIRPALAAGKIVLCDRFMDSTRAYQGGAGGIAMADLQAIEQAVVGATVPDVTFVFDLDAETGLVRAGARGGDDRFERKGLDYHRQVRAAFRAIAAAEPDRCVLVDAGADIDAITAQLTEALQKRGIPG